MADEDVIDHYIDRSGVQSDTTYLTGQLDLVLAKFDELNGLKLRLNVDNSWKDVATTTDQIRQSTDSLTASLVSYRANQLQVVQSNQQVVGSFQAFKDGTTTAASALAILKLQVAENTQNQKAYKLALDSGNLSLDEYVSKQAAAIQRATEYKASITALNAELKNAAAADLAVPNSQAQAGAVNKQLTVVRTNTDVNDLDQVAQLNALIDQNNQLIDANSDKLARQKINIGNYPQAFTAAFTTLETQLEKVNLALSEEGLSGEQIAKLTAQQQALASATELTSKEFTTAAAAATAYKNAGVEIGLAFGVDSEVFQEFNAQLSKGLEELGAIKTAMTNTGTQAGFFSTQMEKAQQGISNIGRTIGRLAAFSIVFGSIDVITAWVTGIWNAANALTNLNDQAAIDKFQIEQLDVVLDGAKNSFEKAFEEVENLWGSFQRAEDGVISSKDAVKEYNDTVGQTIGVVNTLDEAEQKLADHAQAYIQFTLLKAAAQTALQKAAEAAFKAAEDAQKPLSDFQTIADIPASIGAGGVASGGDDNLPAEEAARQKQIEAAQATRRQKEIDAANAEKEALLGIANEFYAKAQKLASDNGLFFDKKTLAQQEADTINAIELQIQELQRWEDKQKDAANNEKLSYDTRRTALLAYNAAVLQVINLNNKKDQIGAIGDPNAQALAASKAQTAIVAANIAGYNALQTLDDSYAKRKADAYASSQTSIIQETVKANEAVYTDETNGLQERLDAYTNYIRGKKALADIDFQQQLADVGFSPAEIAQINAGYNVQLKGKKITNEELEALEAKHDATMTELASTAGKDVYAITSSYYAKQEKAANDANKAQFSASAQDQYNQQLTALNTSFQKQELTVGQYEARRSVIEQQYATARLKVAVDEDNAKLTNLQNVGENLVEEEFSTQQALTQAQALNDTSAIDSNQKKLDAIKNAEQKNADDIAKIQKEAATNQVALVNATMTLLLTAKKQEATDEQTLITAGLDVFKNILDAQYQAKVDEIQSEITASQNKSAAEIAAEQSTTDDAQTQADKIANINAREAQTEQQLQNQENQEKRKEAEVDRIAQVATITQKAISTEFDLAAKAAQAEATGALLLADPATAAYAAIAFASAASIGADEIIVAGIAAAQIAAILASPLPAYKGGTPMGGHPGGKAILGDGGRSELVEFPGGQMFVTPNSPVVWDMPAETIVYPDAKKAMRDIAYSNRRDVSIPRDNGGGSMRQLAAMQARQTDRIVTAINNKQELQIKPGFNSLIMIHKYGERYVKWVGNALHHRH